MNKLILVLLLLCSSTYAVSVKDAQMFCNKWFPALVLGDRDIEEVTSDLMNKFYTDDIELVDPNYSGPVVGKTPVSQYYKAVMSKYPNWEFTIDKIYPTEDGFILHYAGKVPGLVDHFQGVDIIELVETIEGYKIKSLKGFYDRTPFIEAEERDE